jgi:alkanesulfonate monooxygenase SsuD/methylene tetrahydromethanopterin reductase-like flavin-dependent oxidoreductase (luciferase family)
VERTGWLARRGPAGAYEPDAGSRAEDRMKFDLLYEMQMPKPHDAQSEYRCYHEALEQIELADRLGYDTVWEVEHHFLTEFAHSSAPEVFLAAASQRTKNIRLGHGVTLLPHKFNHPIRVAERVAALDILSNGRVEFGTGRSSQFEQAGFEIDTEQSRDMWQESLEMIPRMWTEDPFEHKGRFVSVPARSILPKPLQKPHPPMWMAATSPASWEIAGRNGIGILGLTIFVSVPQLEERVRVYRNALAQARPVGKFVNDRVGAFTIVHVAETRAQAVANGGPEAAINYLLYAFRVLGGFADPSGRGMQRDYADLEIKSTPYRDLIAKEYPIILKMQKNECTFEDLDAEDMVIVGDVDHVIRKVERYQKAGLDHFIALMQVDRVPHDKVMRSIELFAREVIPRFR